MAPLTHAIAAAAEADARLAAAQQGMAEAEYQVQITEKLLDEAGTFGDTPAEVAEAQANLHAALAARAEAARALWRVHAELEEANLAADALFMGTRRMPTSLLEASEVEPTPVDSELDDSSLSSESYFALVDQVDLDHLEFRFDYEDGSDVPDLECDEVVGDL